MTKWPIVEYGTLAASDRSAFSMGPFGSKLTQQDYIASGVPLTRGVNLSRGIFHDADFVFISPEKADEVKAANVGPGDLIFTHRGTIGQVSMIPRNPRFERYVVCSSQVKTRLDPSKAIPEYYYYWFRSPEGQRSILANSSTVGVPGIATPLTSIKHLRVPHPSIRDQIKIAAVLGALDDKIVINDRIARTEEEILRAGFDALQIDVEPATLADGIRACDLVHFNPRVRTPKEDAPYLEMASLPTDYARVSSWTRRLPKSGTKFVNGDTVMARITPCLENGKTAYIDFLEEGEVAIGSTEFIVMRARAGYPSHLPYFLARSPRFRDQAIRNMVGSSGRQRVAASSLEDFPLSRPVDGTIASFGNEAASFFAHMKSLDREATVLAELRDTLLPKLMSGEIKVRDVEKVVEGAL
ncbi:restriction endonuclease subunit S [Nonomuraea sp. M3C6]|uniref:Restriction endonuclease subunit S n=1 Tax=Nonomuraea marmarensis TaxID=3351344 RepID=A0ABW7AUX6_9ACTN